MLEVVISTAVLAVLVLVLSMALIPVQNATAQTALELEMDRSARGLLALLRGDVRASGYKLDGTPQMTAPAPGSSTGPALPVELQFRKRVGPDGDDDTSPPGPPLGWSTPITYRLAADGQFAGVPGTIPRYRLERVQGPSPVTLVRDVSGLTFTQEPNGTLRIRLELLRPNPRWEGSAPPPPLKRVYEARVRMLNPPPPP